MLLEENYLNYLFYSVSDVQLHILNKLYISDILTFLDLLQIGSSILHCEMFQLNQPTLMSVSHLIAFCFVSFFSYK